MAAVKDLEFWVCCTKHSSVTQNSLLQLGEVETLLSSDDTGRDLPSIENLLKKHQLLEADIAAHADRLAEMDTQADALLESELGEREQIDERRNAIKSRYENVKRLAANRRDALNKALNVHQFLRDVDEEESFLTGMSILKQFYYHHPSSFKNVVSSLPATTMVMILVSSAQEILAVKLISCSWRPESSPQTSPS